MADDGRRPYEPPAIIKVKLAAEEMAVSGCKSTMVAANVCRNPQGVITPRVQGS